MTRSCTSRPSTTQACAPRSPRALCRWLVCPVKSVRITVYAAASLSMLHRAPTRPHRHGCDSTGRALCSAARTEQGALPWPALALALALRHGSASGSEDEDELDDETTEGLRHLQARRCRLQLAPQACSTADRLLSRVVHSRASSKTQRWRGRSCSSTWPRHRSPSRRRRPVSLPHRIASHRIACRSLSAAAVARRSLRGARSTLPGLLGVRGVFALRRVQVLSFHPPAGRGILALAHAAEAVGGAAGCTGPAVV
jgi:hypothetical protein